MKKQTILKAAFLVGLLGIGVVLTTWVPVVRSSLTDYCSPPPFLSNAVQPNVLLVVDNSASMNDEAYSGSYDPSQFSNGYYYGYFEPDKMYEYTNNGRWEITTNTVSADPARPIASGNFLNWATMRRIDVSKKLLIGGKASPRSPQGSVTVKLYGENSPSSWDFQKRLDNGSVPGLITPFNGDYYYRMSGDQFFISPVNPGTQTFTVHPNANVSAPASWAVTGAPSAWEAVDETTPDGDATYIKNTTNQDPVVLDYKYAGPKTGTITSIDVYVVAKKSTTATLRIQALLRISGVDYPSNYKNLKTSYDTYISSWSINPSTGLAWQWNEIKATGPETLEGFGVKMYSQPNQNNYAIVTQVYLVVTTSNPSGGPYSMIVDQGMKKAEGIIDHLGNSARFGLAFYNKGPGLESSPPTSNGRDDGGHIDSYIDFGSTTNMITSISNLAPANYTPLSETLYEMVRYFRQDSPYYTGNSPADYQTGSNYDPYYFRYSKLSPSGVDQYVPCAKSYILLLTDGEPTMDTNIPATYKDYDNDSKDPGTYPTNGTDYLDDVAFWARTTDQRSDLVGKQNIFIYSVFMFGKGSKLLMDAAINGGFNDINGDGKPGPDLREYLRDSNGDGNITSSDMPLTYYQGSDGYALEKSIIQALADILKRAASGTAVSVLTTSSRGVGSLVQAYFLPTRQEGIREVTWTGYTQNIWIDPNDNLREDTVNDHKLKLDEDKVMKLYFDSSDKETHAALFTTDADGKGGTLASCSNPEKKRFSEISSLWEAGSKLATKAPSTRTIFTSKAVIRGASSTTFTNNSFSVSNVAGNTTDCSGLTGETLALCSALNSDSTYTASNIVRYVRGECLETGVTGDTMCGNTPVSTYRDRRVEVNNDFSVWKLGDIISSTPKVFSNTPLNTYHVDYADRTYYDYVASDNYKQKSSLTFVGANDGMLHAFRVGYLKDTSLAAGIKGFFQNLFGDTGTDRIGEEVWAYIPFNAFPYLKYLADPGYCHLYYVDLSVRLVDASIGGSAGAARTKDDWRTILIGGMRLGGACSGADASPSPPIAGVGFSSYFAIDVTDPEHPVPLWEFSDADMGYAANFPSIIRTGNRSENGHWYVVAGTGSKVLPKGTVDIGRSTSGYIYILDLKTGTLVKKIQLDHNAIVGDILAIDADKNYHSEKIYFGTTYMSGTAWKGKLMSISIPDQDLSTWSPDSSSIITLFNGDFPFTASPDAAMDTKRNVWVFAGSGKYYSDLDEQDKSAQLFFGIKDKGITLGEGDFYNATNVSTMGNVTGTTQVCTYDPTSDSFGLRTVVNSIKLTSSVPAEPANGWKLYLSTKERVISRPLAAGGLVDFLTYKPDNDPCSFGGSTYLYSVNYTTGVAPSSVAILSPDITSGTSGNVTVYKGIQLGPGAPPAGEAIIIPPAKEGVEQLRKKIQVATGVIVEAEDQPVFSIISKIIHWLKK